MVELDDASGVKGWADEFIAPDSIQDFALALKDAAARKLPVTISGGGTGVTGGRCAQGGLVLSTSRLNRFEVGGPVGAGVPLADIHARTRAAGLLYPPDPTEWTASLGGTIATNASGSRSFRYGSTRRWLESVTAAFIDGRVETFTQGERFPGPYTPVPAPRTTKNTAGYYLPENVTWVDLLAGSEGTLAIVLEARLKLIPLAREILSGVVFFRSMEEALATVPRWRSIEGLNMLEYLDANSLDILRPKYAEIPAAARAALLVERDSGDADAFLDADFMEESWFAVSAADRERFRKFRHTLPELVNERVRLNGFRKLGTDFAVPVGAFAEYWPACVAVLEREFPGKYAAYGHIGDAHVHVNILPETAEDERRGRQWLREEAARVLACGGTLSAEHGLGRNKKWMLPMQFPDLTPFVQVKRWFDPGNRLNPGVLL